jgi:hypothetical protein
VGRPLHGASTSRFLWNLKQVTVNKQAKAVPMVFMQQSSYLSIPTILSMAVVEHDEDGLHRASSN